MLNTPAGPIGSALVLLLLAPAPSLMAHQLYVDAWTEGEEIRLEIYYSDDTPTKGAEVTVRADPGDDVVARGTSDAEGMFRFRPRAGVAHRAVVEDGLGHRGTVSIPASPSAARTAPASGAERAPPPARALRPSAPQRPLAHSGGGPLAWLGPRWVRLASGLLALVLLSLSIRLALCRRTHSRSDHAP